MWLSSVQYRSSDCCSGLCQPCRMPLTQQTSTIITSHLWIGCNASSSGMNVNVDLIFRVVSSICIPGSDKSKLLDLTRLSTIAVPGQKLFIESEVTITRASPFCDGVNRRRRPRTGNEQRLWELIYTLSWTGPL